MAMPPRSAPIVATVHDLAFLDDPGRFTPRGVRFFHRAIDLARRDADVVVCPSEATAAACRRNGFADSRVRVVPWGIDTRPATADDVDRVRRHHRLDRPYVLWLGTIEPRKNVRRLLEAHAALGRDDVELVVAGGAGWNDELAALEARMGRGVRRLGFVPPEDLAGLYAGAEVFCFPSLEEGFGLPVLEAMAQGTPVVTSAGIATAEVVGDAGVTVDPTDVAALTRALRALLDDPDAARRLGRSAAERAGTFTWARTASGLEAAYVDAVAFATGEARASRARR
jgi:glycosyltransferase involved in cell wall biosynthesis